MKIQQRAIEKIKPYPGNPRKNAQAVDPVAASIREFGFRQPIVVDSDGVVIVGHTRLQAAAQLGLATVPVTVASDLTPEQARAYRLADNRTGENAEWDFAGLAEELEALGVNGADLSITGFSEAELAIYLEGMGETDPEKEWQGMPEFLQKDKTAYKSIVINFPNPQAVEDFAKTVGQTITEKTRSIWFPQQEIERCMDKVYRDES